jgi:hypothetical protein
MSLARGRLSSWPLPQTLILIIRRSRLIDNWLQDVTAGGTLAHAFCGEAFRNLRNNVGPTDQSPVLLDTSGQGDLLANLCAGGRCEGEAGSVGLDGDDLGTSGGRTNVDHLCTCQFLFSDHAQFVVSYQNFVLGQLGNLRLLAIGGLDTEQSAEKEVVDLNLGVNVGEMSTETEDETDKTIGTAKRRVDASTNTCNTLDDGHHNLKQLTTYQSDHREQQT